MQGREELWTKPSRDSWWHLYMEPANLFPDHTRRQFHFRFVRAAILARRSTRRGNKLIRIPS